MPETLESRAIVAAAPFDETGKTVYDRSMTEFALEDEYDDDDEPGPTLARPPVSVLRTATYCPECGRTTRVYGLGCAGYKHADFDKVVNDFFFLHHVESLPDDLILILRTICPGYRLDGEVGAPFFPAIPDEFKHIKIIRRIPLEGDFPIKSSCTVGGGEYLTEER
jgi:hypothetical protein